MMEEDIERETEMVETVMMEIMINEDDKEEIVKEIDEEEEMTEMMMMMMEMIVMMDAEHPSENTEGDTVMMTIQ